jgi:hypothetical protein
MSEQLLIKDLPADQISYLLQADSDELSPQETAAVRYFIDEIGGEENAWRAVRMLQNLELGE